MEEMKQTGIQWIGEIPSTWNTKRIKYMATLKGRIGWQGLTSEEYQDEGAYLITGVDFADGGIDWDSCVHVPMKRWEEARDIQIENGDLLITKDGTIGKVAIVSNMPGETSLNSGVLRIMPIEGYSRRFLYWVIKSEEFWNWFNYKNAGNSTIAHLYQGDFAEFLYAFPTYDEQEAIADFLDERCGKLDSIIKDIEVQVDKIKTYKVSLITESVTKGLAKDVPMKESGYAWIGKIPAHWEMKRLKYVLEPNGLKVGPFGSTLSADEYVDEGKWVYNQRIVLDDNFEENDICVTEEKFRELIGFKVSPGDVLITTRGTIGRTAIVPENATEGILHPCIIRFRPDTTVILPEFIKMVFNESSLIKDQFLYMSNATTIDVIYSYTLKDIVVPCIPHDEQLEILRYLEETTKVIDEVIAKKETQLLAMKQHRASLIFEYVTGKKRVKEVR